MIFSMRTKAFVGTGLVVAVAVTAGHSALAADSEDDRQGRAATEVVDSGQTSAAPWSLVVGPGYDESHPESTCIVLAQGVASEAGGGGRCSSDWSLPSKAPLTAVMPLETRARGADQSIDETGQLRILAIGVPDRPMIVEGHGFEKTLLTDLEGARSRAVTMDGIELTVVVATVPGSVSDQAEDAPLEVAYAGR